MINVEIDDHSGFCFGVTTAIRKAEEELQRGAPLYCLGDIVHNGMECERLRSMGLIAIDHEQFKALRDVRVLLRAHGEPPETYDTARLNNIEIIDATCPVVLNIQKRIKQEYTTASAMAKQIVIYGQKGHAEVLGLVGQTDGNAIVIESIHDLSKLDFSRPIYLFSQTTKSVEEFEAIVKRIENERANRNDQVIFEYYNSICKNVANRVKRLQDFARNNDIVLFVGGKKSSNAKVLYNNCLEVNSSTIFVSAVADITAEILQLCHNAEHVGICGATSTPKWLMEEVKQFIVDSL